VSADGRPSYEELAALVVRLAEEIERLKVEVADLRRWLGHNSPHGPTSSVLMAARSSRSTLSGLTQRGGIGWCSATPWELLYPAPGRALMHMRTPRTIGKSLAALLIVQPHLLFASLVVCASGAGLVTASPS
jgi:hypothetical protein